jgi:hypothetical protein
LGYTRRHTSESFVHVIPGAALFFSRVPEQTPTIRARTISYDVLFSFTSVYSCFYTDAAPVGVNDAKPEATL